MIIRGDEPIWHYKPANDTTDKYGNPVYTYTSTLIRDALFAFAGGSETDSVDRKAVDYELTLYLAHGTQVDVGDYFEIRDTFWDVDGVPTAYPTAVGFETGVVVKVKKRRG